MAVPAAGHVEIQKVTMQEVLARTLFVALAASHGFIILRAVVRHVLERFLWYESVEKKRLDKAAREIKEQYVQSVQRRGGPALGEGETAVSGEVTTTTAETPSGDEFWQFDEGLDEIRKGIKDS